MGEGCRRWVRAAGVAESCWWKEREIDSVVLTTLSLNTVSYCSSALPVQVWWDSPDGSGRLCQQVAVYSTASCRGEGGLLWGKPSELQVNTPSELQVNAASELLVAI